MSRATQQIVYVVNRSTEPLDCMSDGVPFVLRPGYRREPIINQQTGEQEVDAKTQRTDEACGKGAVSWVRNMVMLTSVRPDFASGRASVEGIETKMSRWYGFIAPAGLSDYAGASASERGYGYIGDASNLTGGTDGYYIW